MARRPHHRRRRGTSPTLLALFGLCAMLAACGGGGSSSVPETPTPEVPTPADPALTPAPHFSYTPETATCDWVAAHIAPFVWPTQTVGPRNWPPVQVETVVTPQRNAKGEALYHLTSNAWVLQGHYEPQIAAKRLAYSSTQLWAQQAVCQYGIRLERSSVGPFTDTWSAYLPDETAQRLAQEQYTAGIRQVRQEDPCNPTIVITGMPLPPECSAKAP